MRKHRMQDCHHFRLHLFIRESFNAPGIIALVIQRITPKIEGVSMIPELTVTIAKMMPEPGYNSDVSRLCHTGYLPLSRSAYKPIYIRR
jgi:hypothetical protein